MKTDGARLIMCLILLQNEFLARDATLERRQLDAGLMNPFWDKCAKVFNGTDEYLDTMHGDEGGRFSGLGLDSFWSGFVATGAILKAKFNELRAAYMAIIVSLL